LESTIRERKLLAGEEAGISDWKLFQIRITAAGGGRIPKTDLERQARLQLRRSPLQRNPSGRDSERKEEQREKKKQREKLAKNRAGVLLPFAPSRLLRVEDRRRPAVGSRPPPKKKSEGTLRESSERKRNGEGSFPISQSGSSKNNCSVLLSGEPKRERS